MDLHVYGEIRVRSREQGLGHVGIPKRLTDVTNASVHQANGTFQIEHRPLCVGLERFPVVLLITSLNPSRSKSRSSVAPMFPRGPIEMRRKFSQFENELEEDGEA